METIHFKIGPNLGNILLEICQDEISKGNIDKAISTYVDYLNGFTKEYVLKVLKNEFVLITQPNGEGVELTDDKDIIEKNEHNILDWNYIIDSRLQTLYDCRDTRRRCMIELGTYQIDPANFDIKEYTDKYLGNIIRKEDFGFDNILAKILAGGKNSKKFYSNGGKSWDSLEYNALGDDPLDYEKIFYNIARYVDMIKYLHKGYMNFINTYEFLVNNNFITRRKKVEDIIESTLYILTDFCDPEKSYNHPMCDKQIKKLKETIENDILTTSYGKIYAKYHILEKNFEDGYDAGFLSPEGIFYGEDGPTSSMIHMRICETLFVHKFNKEMLKDKCGLLYYPGYQSGFSDPENWLMNKGWMKVHNDEIYGHYKHRKNEEEDEVLYCPTEKQINMICNYADTYYNGVISTQPRIVENNEVKTRDLRQMDEIKLHETFSIF